MHLARERPNAPIIILTDIREAEIAVSVFECFAVIRGLVLLSGFDQDVGSGSWRR